MADPLKERLAFYTSANAYAALPLPREIVPTSNDFWDNFSDEEIIAMPPHVAVHIMRTIAQNGAQVISPRQVPSTMIVKRVSNASADPFVHLAGSNASVTAQWPVPPGCRKPVLGDMEGEPIRKHGAPLAARSPARTTPLVSGLARVANPVHRAWIKARARCDFEAQEGVGGDAEALASAYERAYGAEPGSLMADPGISVPGPVDFQEHAIVVDNKLARQLAPVQARRVLAVAVGPSNAECFGANRAFDWTCARTIAETKFRLTVSNEGHSLTDIACTPEAPVGLLLTHKGLRPGHVLAYHPTAATAWSYDPATFAAHATMTARSHKASVNKTVAAELARASGFASPIAAAVVHKAAVSWVRTVIPEASTNVRNNDALGSFRGFMTSSVFSMKSVSRDVGKGLRAELYTALESAPLNVMCKLMRALVVVKEMVMAMGDDMSVDSNAITSLANRLVSIDSHINVHMLQTAAYRGQDPEMWFAKMAKSVPAAYRPLKMGTRGWAVIAVHHLLKPPDKKWTSLISAMRSKTIDNMANTLSRAAPDVVTGAVKEQRVDLIRMSCEKTLAAIRMMYGANYDGAALGCAVVARMADSSGLESVAKACRISAAGWTFRQLVVQSFRCRATADDPDASACFEALEIPQWVAGTDSVGYIAISADMRTAYRSWAQKIARLSPTTAPPASLLNYSRPTVLAIMLERRPMVGLEREAASCEDPAVTSKPALAYATNPSALPAAVTSTLTWAGRDCQKTVDGVLREMEADDAVASMEPDAAILAVPTRAASAVKEVARVVSKAATDAFFASEAKKAAKARTTGWFWLAKTDPEDAYYIGETSKDIPGHKELMESTFATIDEFLDAFDMLESCHEMAQKDTTDAFAT